MSWLSSLTGIHIGNKPAQLPDAPPPNATPQQIQDYESGRAKVNGTIGQAGAVNQGAIGVAGLTAAGLGAGALGIGGAGAAGTAAGAGGDTSPMAPGSEFPGGQVPDTGGDSSGLISGLMDAAKGGAGAVASFLKNNGAGLLQAAGIADSAYRETQANKYANQALQTAQSAYDAKAPIRALGIAGLQNAGQGNPFATRTGGALPVAGQGGLGANTPGLSSSDAFGVLTNMPQTPHIPRVGPVAAPIAPPTGITPQPAPMRIAGT